MLNIDLDMRVDDGEEISMSLDGADELQIGANEVYLVGDHATLAHRDSADQHPISAITGLTATLDELLDDIPTKVSQLQNDSGYITSGDIPTKTSDLQNDSGFITEDDIPPIPTKTSELQNDSGFLTSAVTSFNGQTGAVTYNAPVTSVNSKTGAVTLNASDVGALPSSTTIPTKTSQLNNDSGFITGIDSTDVTSALGYTPYSDANPSGYISGINSTDVTTALGYTPYNGTTNPNGYVTTDNKTEQSYISNPSSYSYWRGLAIGANASSTENGALATTTDKVYVADAIRVQPSTGTVKATTFKGDLTGDVTGDVVGDVTGNLTGDVTGTADKADVAYGFFYGVIDNTSTRTAFTAQVAGITEYYTGLCVFLKNTTGAATNTNVTLDINGLGAKKIYNSQALTTQVSTQWGNGYTVLLYYDETRDSDNGGWVWYYGYNSDTNTIGYNIRTYSGSLPMSSKVYRYRLLFENRNGQYVPANNSTSTNSTTARTPVTEDIDPFGRITYYSYTTALSAGDKPGTSYQYQQFGPITLGYSFTGITLTANKPMYLVLNPQSNGLAKIDQTTPVTQTLPSTDDGKLYVFLGLAIDSTTFTLTLQHPVYWYKDGKVRIYNGSPYIPEAPTTDGTYTLQVTVSSGVPTYAWV